MALDRRSLDEYWDLQEEALARLAHSEELGLKEAMDLS
jgi:hypothetical protein